MQSRVARLGATTLAIVSVSVLLAGCVGSSSNTSPRGTTAHVARVETPDQTAVAQAQELLASAKLPTGARAIAATSDLPAAPIPSCTPTIERSRFATIPSTTPGAVREYIAGHLPAGLTLTNVGVPSLTDSGTGFSVSAGGDYGDELHFRVAPTTGGAVNVRIDAIVIEPQGACQYDAVGKTQRSVSPLTFENALATTTNRARNVLEAVVLPVGAETVANLPGSDFESPATYSLCNPTVDLSRFAVVRGYTLTTLKNYFAGHPAAGLTYSGAGSTTIYHTGHTLAFTVMEQDSTGGELAITIAPTTGGDIGVRIDSIATPAGASCLYSGGGMASTTS